MRRTSRPRSIVFDFDGTLVDSLPLVLAAIQHAIEPFGGRTSMEIFAHLGGPPERFMPQLVGDAARVPEALERMQTFHHQNIHLIRPYVGAQALLEHLALAGVRVAVWTGRDRDSTLLLLRLHGLEDLLDTVVCGDDLPTHKPQPAGLQEIGRRLATPAGEMLLVGDADVDVLGGHACGVDTVLIRHGRSIREEILEKAWQTVSTPAEAFAMVRAYVER